MLLLLFIRNVLVLICRYSIGAFWARNTALSPLLASAVRTKRGYSAPVTASPPAEAKLDSTVAKQSASNESVWKSDLFLFNSIMWQHKRAGTLPCAAVCIRGAHFNIFLQRFFTSSETKGNNPAALSCAGD